MEICSAAPAKTPIPRLVSEEQPGAAAKALGALSQLIREVERCALCAAMMMPILAAPKDPSRASCAVLCDFFGRRRACPQGRPKASAMAGPKRGSEQGSAHAPEKHDGSWRRRLTEVPQRRDGAPDMTGRQTQGGFCANAAQPARVSDASVGASRPIE